VLSRRAFGKHVALVVVQVAHRTFLVGQSVQQITLLAELEGTQWPEAGASAGPVVSDDHLLAPRTALGNGEDSPGAWDAFLDRLREMTVRR
jgi:flagellar biogenesis protein FliO